MQVSAQEKGTLVWFTDGPKTNEGTGTGIRKKICFSLDDTPHYSRQKLYH
jgi:hypothetical protein